MGVPLEQRMEPAPEPSAVRRACPAQDPGLVRLFEEEPDLIVHLEPGLAAAARRRVVARVHLLARGAWEPELEWLAPDVMGLLVLDGLLVRHIEIAGRRAAELVGPGDLLSPRYEGEVFNSVLPASVSWLVVEPIRAAVIDAAVQEGIWTLPGVMNELFGRAVKRAGTVTSQHVSKRLAQLETRLLWILWQLADRWGRRSVDGVLLTLPLTHGLLSDLASANRPAVSRALGRLTDAGRVSRQDGRWRLHDPPPLDWAREHPAGQGAPSRGYTSTAKWIS